MSTITTYFVNVSSQPRGNDHGYTAYDYAKDVADELNEKICNEGVSTEKSQVEEILEKCKNEISCADVRSLFYIDFEKVETDG